MDTNLELSYEFFPPRTDAGRETLTQTRRELESRSPEFFSVTFGAGGSTRDKTMETVVDIQQNSPVDACPHLTCVGASNEEVIELLETYREHGIHRLLVLRGDPPSGMVGRGDCNHANELMEVIIDHFSDYFSLLAAAYPEGHPDSKSMQTEVDYFVQKMNTGADAAITQYFYQHQSYVHFMDLCKAKGLDKPVIPGIMPIANFATLKRFSRICGADIPRWIKKSMASYEDDPQSQRELGVDIVTHLCEQLIADGAPGLHFYTMNQSALTCRILDNLGLPKP
jgi:methylenetetrahydrofolate reductase (NADPH)